MRIGLGTGVSQKRGGGPPPVVVTSISPTSGNELGGTAVTITGSGFTGKLSANVTVGGSQLGSFSVVNDTTITGTTAAHARGAVDVVVGTTTSAGAYTYLDALSTVFGTCELWYRADKGITLAGSLVSVAADQSGTGDALKNLVDDGLTKRPTLYTADAAFNGRDTWGITSDAEKRLITASFAAPIARPYTIYRVIRIPASAAAVNIYWGLSGAGSGTNASMLYCVGSTGAATVGSGNGNNAFTLPTATTMVVCCVYGATTVDVYVNQHTTKTVNGGAAGDQALASTSIGTWGAEACRYLFRELAVYDGAHSQSQRQSWMARYAGDQCGITVGT